MYRVQEASVNKIAYRFIQLATTLSCKVKFEVAKNITMSISNFLRPAAATSAIPCPVFFLGGWGVGGGGGGGVFWLYCATIRFVTALRIWPVRWSRLRGYTNWKITE